MPADVAGQTTQGLIAGQVYNRETGTAVPGATVECFQYTPDQPTRTIARSQTLTNTTGFYALAFRSPGVYRIRITSALYQAHEEYGVELPVAGHLQLNIGLRPLSDVWEAGQFRSVFFSDSKSVLTFYGPDVDSTHTEVIGGHKPVLTGMEPTVSYTIDPEQLSALPISGRNVYELLLFQPGVTGGLSVNGQHSGSFLLDGVDSGIALSPEFVQEYRVSENNYSVEFGRATGFIANAITKSGAESFHGMAYTYLGNEILNANAFQSNFNGFPRPRFRELRAGFWAGGPVISHRTFFSVGYEGYRSNTRAYPYPFEVPVLENFQRCSATAHSQALALLERFPPPLAAGPSSAPCDHLSATYSVAIPTLIDRGFGLIRFDHLLRGGSDRLFAQVITNRETDPDATYSLYPGFTSAQRITTFSTTVGTVFQLSERTTTELRLGWQNNSYDLPRPYPEVPTLTTPSLFLLLPGLSPSVSAQLQRNGELELADTTILVRSRHFISLGGGLYLTGLRSSNNYLQSGDYTFSDLQSFGEDRATAFDITLSRSALLAGAPLAQPPYERRYGRRAFYGFVSDSYSATKHLAVNFGLRYDGFGSPENIGYQDGYVRLNSEASIPAALPAASLIFGVQCCSSSYTPDRRDWAARVGLSYDLTGSGRHVFRFAYGIFYDPTPGASLVNNDFENTLFLPGGASSYFTPNYSRPQLESVAGAFVYPEPALKPYPVLIDPRFRAPRVQSWFGGYQHEWSSNLLFQINGVGSVGQRLITTDYINRSDATLRDSTRLNPNLPLIQYESNSGYSQYNAMTALVRYRTNPVLVQMAYTWGHSIDNEVTPFTRQFDRWMDRGNSDFDQRQNLVAYAIARLPDLRGNHLSRGHTLLAGWQIGTLLAFRSGFPYSVQAVGNLPACGSPTEQAANSPANNVYVPIGHPRASLIPGVEPELSPPIAAPGGVQFLNQTAFCRPPPNSPGNLGRNSFRGPGSWSVDMSTSKSFPIRWLGEAGGVQFRADFFNAFNHANLGFGSANVVQTGAAAFGEAFYGEHAAPSGGVSFVPLDETPRRIELQIRVFF